MTITQVITELPPNPDPATDSADDFSDKAAASVLAQKNMVPELNTMIGQMNATATQVSSDATASAASQSAAASSAASAAASAASSVASATTNGTSTTSLTLGAGTQSLTTQTGKNWAPGMWINCVRTSDRSKSMSGYIDSYNSGTGALALIVVAANVAGSGTFTDWTLTVAGLPGSIFNLVDLSLLGPSIKPSLLADFANAKRLDSRFVYTMTSPLMYTDAAGILREAAAGVPAFDHDPTTGRCLGLSMWEARTNVLLYCRDLTNASWTKSSMTTALTQTGADGATNSATLLTATGSNATAIQSVTLASSARYFTAYVKRVTGAGAVEMTLDNGATWTAITSSINTSTWTRCRIPTQTLANPQAGFRLATNGDAIAVDFTQNENGTFETPPIATTSVAVTRAAPSLTIALSAFEFNALEGVIYAAGDVGFISSGNATLVRLDDGTDNNRFMMRISSAVLKLQSITGGVNDVDINVGAPTVGVQAHMAGAYRVNDFAASKDGAAAVTDTSGAVPTVTTLRIGGEPSGANMVNGRISKFAYYPRRLVNNELVALSTL
ncbi:hypothetical protein GJ700_12745 [Duganella sp. FT92W]|uniref:Uncharacterized protein n=1 Tax=Pseudoduganella rivuli TaxID=2666085 RepID=A0A7X2IM64_9BURK|nr:hypothetical protein [Pseudoduganella rivuli]MRV72576.1 hypothetical protein [Pseudoduganella rivuli]